jgi:hypothetical protein
MAVSTWWKVNKYAVEITPVGVVKETEKFITLAPTVWFKREMRVAKSNEYFPTFAAARTYLLEHFSRNMESARQQITTYKKYWDKVFLMEPPKDTK